MVAASAQARATRRTAIVLALVAAAMVGVGFAAVPLYRIFCQATGYGGTPRRLTEDELAELQTPARALAGRPITIRFDANHAENLPWTFRPEKPDQMVSVGARSLAIFLATNTSDHPITGTATYNIEPEQAAHYFTKIQCFCFTQQTLGAHESARMPVLFYVDPKIDDDPDAKGIDTITLSYTFYPVDGAKKAG